MASKRINIIPLTVEALEYLIGVPQGHHIENVVYQPSKRTINIHLSGDSMDEVSPGEEIRWRYLHQLVQQWQGRKTKHTECPPR